MYFWSVPSITAPVPTANGLEKVALFGKEQGGTVIPTHAALQLETGEWTSRLGHCEDVRHAKVEDVCGPLYGSVVCFLSRPRR